MDRLLTLLLSLVLAGGLAFGWDRHAPVHYVLPWWMGHIHVGLPDSLASQRDDAVRAENLALQAQKACRASLDSQNASIALQGQKSRDALAASEHDLQATRAVVESYRQAGGKLAVYVPKGETVCQRWEDADRAVVGSLGP